MRPGFGPRLRLDDRPSGFPGAGAVGGLAAIGFPPGAEGDWGQRMASALRGIGGDSTIEATIRNEIIPRLMLAFRNETQNGAPTDADSLAIAQFALDGDEDGASAHLDALSARGVALDDLFLDVLAPAARRIGAAWETDERGFAEVSVALTRLHRLFRDRQPTFQNGGGDDDAPRALIAPAPGEHHILGALMVEAFFVRAGWRVDTSRFETRDELIAAARAQPFAIVGLSIRRTAAGGERTPRPSARCRVSAARSPPSRAECTW